MVSTVRRYTDEIQGQFGYWATWFPSSHVRLGDLGPMRKRVFDPQLNLEDLGVELDPLDAGEPLQLQHKSVNGVDVAFQSKGGNQLIPQIPQGTAGIDVTFSRSGGVVFALRNGRSRRLRDLSAVGRELIRLIQEGSVPREYALVTHVVDAEAVSVLVSNSSGAKFVASAQADLGAGLLDLANIEAGLSVVTSSNVETELVAATGATPLVKLSGFKRSGWFWGSPRVAPLGFDSDDDLGALDELSFDDADPDDSAG